jgi:hypothetical protein
MDIDQLSTRGMQKREESSDLGDINPDSSQKRRKREDSSLLEKMNLPLQMLMKTELCKHKHGCVENCLRGFYRGFVMAFLVKSIFALLPKIVNPVKLFKTLLNKKSNLDSMRFALFLGFLNSVYKGTLCTMRRICKDDRINAAIAGFVSSFAIMIDDKKRRIFFVLVFLSRCIDVVINMLEKRGIIKKINNFEVFAWCSMACFNKYCMSYEPDCLNKGFRNFYLKASAMT